MSQHPPPPPPPPPPAAPPPGWAPGPWQPAPAVNLPPGWGRPGTPPPGWSWQQPAPILPGSGRFRAQAVGELLNSAFTLYRRNVPLILAITAVAQLPLAAFSYVVYQVTDVASALSRLQQLSSRGALNAQQLSDLGSSAVRVVGVLIAVGLLQALVVQPVATAAMTRAVGDVYLGKEASFGGAYRAVGQRLGAVVGVSLLLFGAGLALIAVTAAVLVASVLLLGSGGAAILVVVLPAAIVLAIVMYTRWLFAAPIVMLERRGPTAALRRSWHLVTGSTGRVFGITLLVGIITGILSAIVGALLGIATHVGDAGVRLLLNQLASLVVAVLIQPITFIVVVLLYYDLRIRREAFDIEMLAANL